MTINLVRSGRLYDGVPYAYASVAPRGSLIFTAGACPLDHRGEVVGVGDVGAQAVRYAYQHGLATPAQ